MDADAVALLVCGVAAAALALLLGVLLAPAPPPDLHPLDFEPCACRRPRCSGVRRRPPYFTHR